MKETCEFWEDHLKTLPDGKLVVPNGWSPEHGPPEDGVSYNQEIVWDLFNNYVEAADTLGVDKSYRDKIAAMRDRLVTPGIGSWGQLLEWVTEKKGTNAVPGQPGTRHAQRSSPPHLASVRPSSGTPRSALPGHRNWRRRRKFHSMRAATPATCPRMVIRVAHGALCAPA